GSWSTGVMMKGPGNATLTIDNASLAFVGDAPRVVTRLRLTNYQPLDTVYFECDEIECAQDFDWHHVFLKHPEGKSWANWDVAVSQDGQVRVALYEPAPQDIFVGGELYYGECDGLCSVAENWQLTHVNSSEGKNCDLAIYRTGA